MVTTILGNGTTIITVASTGATLALATTFTGVAGIAAGTVLLPSLARSSDLDTGLWFPAANNIGVSTGGVERIRIDSAGSMFRTQAAPATVNATATMTITNLYTQIVTSTTAAAVDATLPTGTSMETMYSAQTNMGYEWSVINTGANTFTVVANTDHTVVGNMVVAATSSGQFKSRRTAANTWITYRIG